MGAALNNILAFALRSVRLAERKRLGVLKERVSAAPAVSRAIGSAGVDAFWILLRVSKATPRHRQATAIPFAHPAVRENLLQALRSGS